MSLSDLQRPWLTPEAVAASRERGARSLTVCTGIVMALLLLLVLFYAFAPSVSVPSASTSSALASTAFPSSPPSRPAVFPGFYVDDSYSLARHAPLSLLNSDVLIGQSLYVDPVAGSDGASGLSPSTALRSVEAAQRLVRRLIPRVNGSIVVELLPGTYYQNRTLSFDSSDSFSSDSGHYVIYRGGQPQSQSREPAVISGGVRLPNDWHCIDPSLNIWRLSVPFSMVNLSLTRNVWVDDRRMIRARTRILNQPISLTSPSADCSSCALPPIPAPSPVEVVGLLGFTSSRCQAVLYPNRTLTFGTYCWQTMIGGPYNFPWPVTWMENSLLFLNKPGHGVIDGANQAIYYIPLPGRSISSSRFEVPVLNTLMMINSTSNLAVVGAVFSHSNWRQASTAVGYFTDQADLLKSGSLTLDAAPNDGTFSSIPAAVWCYQCSNVAFIQSTFAHLGNTALWVDILSRGSLVWLNVFYDVSGSGLRVGRYPTTFATSETWIEDNHVYDTGKEYIGACGMFIAIADNAFVNHNTVHDIPYTGISVGLGWTAAYSPLNLHNPVTNNDIYNVMTMLCDGAAVYLNARQDGTVVAQNYFHDISTADTYWALYTDVFLCPGQGLYFDEGSCLNSTLVERDNVFDRILQLGMGLDFAFTDHLSPPGFVDRPNYATNDYVLRHAGARALPVHVRSGERLGFGGMFGTAYVNPVTSSRSCPDGYRASQVLYSNQTDDAVFYCWSVLAADEAPLYLLGGVFSNSTWQSYRNPLSGCYSCPDTSFSIHSILGINASIDSPLYYCMRLYNATNSGDAKLAEQFGGFFGYGMQKAAMMYPLPLTSTDACLPSHTAVQVLGIPLFDYPLFICLSSAPLQLEACPVHHYTDQSLAFGGLLGTVEGVPAVNYLTGVVGCPSGYLSQRIWGSSMASTIDYALTLCYSFLAPGAAPEWEFGGAFGGDFVNPFTRSASCPESFDMVQALGTMGIDSPFYYCVRAALGASGVYARAFGGFIGVSISRQYDNALTTSSECPMGFRRSPIFGSLLPLDYPIELCAADPYLHVERPAMIRQAARTPVDEFWNFDAFGLQWLPLPCDSSSGCETVVSSQTIVPYNTLNPHLYSAALTSSTGLSLSWNVSNGHYSLTLLLFDFVHAPREQTISVRVNGVSRSTAFQPAPTVDYSHRANNLVVDDVAVTDNVLQVTITGSKVVLNGVQVQPMTLPNYYRTLHPQPFLLPLERDFLELATGMNATSNLNYQYPSIVFGPSPPRASALSTVPLTSIGHSSSWLIAAPYPAGGLTANYSKCIWTRLSSDNAAGRYDLLGSPEQFTNGSHFLAVTTNGTFTFGHGRSAQPGAYFTLPTFALDRWYHICATYAASSREYTLYLNGTVRVSSVGTAEEPEWTGGLPLVLGGQLYFSYAPLGSFQCVQWYPFALSDSQIRRIYEDEVGGECGVHARPRSNLPPLPVRAFDLQGR